MSLAYKRISQDEQSAPQQNVIPATPPVAGAPQLRYKRVNGDAQSPQQMKYKRLSEGSSAVADDPRMNAARSRLDGYASPN